MIAVSCAVRYVQSQPLALLPPSVLGGVLSLWCILPVWVGE